MTFKEFYLKESFKYPSEIKSLYNYVKDGNSKFMEAKSVDIVSGTFFHFTRADEHRFESGLKFNKDSFVKDFTISGDFDFGKGFIYAYQKDDLDDKKRMIKSTYGRNCIVFDAIAVNVFFDMDQEFQNVVAISTIKNISFIEDFFDTVDSYDKYSNIESFR